MTYQIIGTWRMSTEGVGLAQKALVNGLSKTAALIEAIKNVEDNPNFGSVGFGGLPNKNGQVQLDAGFMDGNNFNVGAVAGSEKIKNPIEVAVQLANESANNFLIGYGADEYAKEHGFSFRDNLTENATKRYLARKKQVEEEDIKPYDGHDTVGVIIQDDQKEIVVGTSTSGLFMKEPGRVGDSPMPGNGYYAISGVGAAAATGMGEDIMKGALSYQTVQNMANGMDAQTAVQTAGESFVDLFQQQSGSLPREISLIALDASGNFGVYTNVQFYFALASDKTELSLYSIKPNNDLSGEPYIYEKADLANIPADWE